MIKFRAMCSVSGDFIYGVPVFIGDYNNYHYLTHENDCTKRKIIPQTLTQYLNIKDDHDIEIFEEDIIELNNGKLVIAKDYETVKRHRHDGMRVVSNMFNHDRYRLLLGDDYV